MEVTINEIKRKFDELPEELRWAIVESNVDQKIVDIGQEHDLNVAQMGQLSLETQMVMYGFLHPEKFEDSLNASLGVPAQKVRNIVEAVNSRVLKKLREKIMNLHGSRPVQEEKPLPQEEPEIEEGQELGEIDLMEEINRGKEEQKKKIIQSIANQKLTDITPSEKVDTEYSLGNIKSNKKERRTIDPYRMDPNE